MTMPQEQGLDSSAGSRAADELALTFAKIMKDERLLALHKAPEPSILSKMSLVIDGSDSQVRSMSSGDGSGNGETHVPSDYKRVDKTETITGPDGKPMVRYTNEQFTSDQFGFFASVDLKYDGNSNNVNELVIRDRNGAVVEDLKRVDGKWYNLTSDPKMEHPFGPDFTVKVEPNGHILIPGFKDFTTSVWDATPHVLPNMTGEWGLGAQERNADGTLSGKALLGRDNTYNTNPTVHEHFQWDTSTNPPKVTTISFEPDTGGTYGRLEKNKDGKWQLVSANGNVEYDFGDDDITVDDVTGQIKINGQIQNPWDFVRELRRFNELENRPPEEDHCHLKTTVIKRDEAERPTEIHYEDPEHGVDQTAEVQYNKDGKVSELRLPDVGWFRLGDDGKYHFFADDGTYPKGAERAGTFDSISVAKDGAVDIQRNAPHEHMSVPDFVIPDGNVIRDDKGQPIAKFDVDSQHSIDPIVYGADGKVQSLTITDKDGLRGKLSWNEAEGAYDLTDKNGNKVATIKTVDVDPKNGDIFINGHKHGETMTGERIGALISDVLEPANRKLGGDNESTGKDERGWIKGSELADGNKVSIQYKGDSTVPSVFKVLDDAGNELYELRLNPKTRAVEMFVKEGNGERKVGDYGPITVDQTTGHLMIRRYTGKGDALDQIDLNKFDYLAAKSMPPVW